jgi:hypothetical protein
MFYSPTWTGTVPYVMFLLESPHSSLRRDSEVRGFSPSKSAFLVLAVCVSSSYSAYWILVRALFALCICS